MVEKRKQPNSVRQLMEGVEQAKRRRAAAAAQREANADMRAKMQQALKNAANRREVERAVQGIMRRLIAQNKSTRTVQEMRNAETARLSLEQHRANKQRKANAQLRRNLMGGANTYGTMLPRQPRPRTAEAMYQRMVGQVMRRTTFTPTDFKQLGKIVKARSDERWGDVERLIKEWETMVKRRVCRLKKGDMQGIAFGLNINTAGGKKKKAQLCQEIKNKI